MAKNCCVCGTDSASSYKQYAGREYCADCLKKITSHRRHAVRASGIFEILSLLILVALFGLLGKVLNLSAHKEWRLVFSLFSAVAVSIVFLVLFYRQDRLEPEPKKLIVLMFLGGAALPIFIVNPLLEAVFSYSKWGNHSFLLNFLGNIFVVGMMMELFKLLLVRFTIYPNGEFDEIVDGVVYMSVAGLGYATALNIQYVLGNSGVDLLVGTVRMAAFALMHASISGMIGFFLGKNKFGGSDRFGVAFSLMMGAFIWGLYYLVSHFTQTGLSFNPWIQLVVSMLLALVVMLFTVGLMQITIKKIEKNAA